MSETTPLAYADLFDLFERDHIRYVVVGGMAVVLHGYNRPVADLDVVVDADPQESQRAMRVLMQAGFVPTIPLPLSALTVLRMFDARQREVDVFVRFRIPFGELWTSSEPLAVGDTVARVMSLEHLLRVKRLDRRPQDLADIGGLGASAAAGE